MSTELQLFTDDQLKQLENGNISSLVSFIGNEWFKAGKTKDEQGINSYRWHAARATMASQILESKIKTTNLKW